MNYTLKFPSKINPKSEKTMILKPRGFWTKDEVKIEASDFEGPEGANDVHVILEIKLSAQFTKDGEPIGGLISAPEGANDCHIELELIDPTTIQP